MESTFFKSKTKGDEPSVSTNNIWSDNIQGVMTLYLSRQLRFDDMFFDQYQKAFGLDRHADLKILEVGWPRSPRCRPAQMVSQREDHRHGPGQSVRGLRPGKHPRG